MGRRRARLLTSGTPLSRRGVRKAGVAEEGSSPLATGPTGSPLCLRSAPPVAVDERFSAYDPARYTAPTFTVALFSAPSLLVRGIRDMEKLGDVFLALSVPLSASWAVS